MDQLGEARAELRAMIKMTDLADVLKVGELNENQQWNS